jgi:hypothetical protein
MVHLSAVQRKAEPGELHLGSGSAEPRRVPGCQTRAHGTVHMAYILQDKGWGMAHDLHQL